MVKRVTALSLALLGVLSSGCIAVSSHDNRWGPNTEIVPVNDRVYIVDKDTGKAWEVDLTCARSMPPTGGK